MTTTVKVKARAWGAVVSLRPKEGGEGNTFNLAPSEEREFHIEANHVLEVEQGPEPQPLSELFEKEEAKAAAALDDEKPSKADKESKDS